MINARDFHAVGDGRASDTASIQAAIDEVARRGGGSVLLSAGTYLCGALSLRSFVTLHLESGAVILGSEDPDDYPVIEARWEGETRKVHAPLIGGIGLSRIGLAGRGTVDGRGEVWWKRFNEKTLRYARPRLISFTDCEAVRIEGITAVNSPSWTINPVRCDDLVIDGVTIKNPPDSPNTDGIDPDSCARVRISNCLVSVGDDCITLKSGTERERPELRLPCRDVAITNCILEKGHGGVVIGSETTGGVRNIVISNCVFNGTDRGIRVKTRRGRGGIVEDVRVTNVIMNDVLCPFTVNMYYGCGAWGNPVVSDKGARPVDETTPRVRRIGLANITARGARYAAAFVYGLAEMPVEDVTLSDVSIAMDPDSGEGFPEMADGLELMSRDGFFARYTRGLTLERVRIEGQRGPAFLITDSEELDLAASGTRTVHQGSSVILLKGVRGAFIHGCRAAPGTGSFLGLEGTKGEEVTLEANDLSRRLFPSTHLPAEPGAEPAG